MTPSGEDSFTYVASDGELESELATVTLTVEDDDDEEEEEEDDDDDDD